MVAIAALFFLGFAYFAVGQASVLRNSTQSAADAAALAAARAGRDQLHEDFLAALTAGDTDALSSLLNKDGDDVTSACATAATYAVDNGATVQSCSAVSDPPGYSVAVRSVHPVGRTAVKGTENVYATAEATAIVKPRCSVEEKNGDAIRFSCTDGELTIDPTADGFTLHLSDFYTVRLSK